MSKATIYEWFMPLYWHQVLCLSTVTFLKRCRIKWRWSENIVKGKDLRDKWRSFSDLTLLFKHVYLFLSYNTTIFYLITFLFITEVSIQKQNNMSHQNYRQSEVFCDNNYHRHWRYRDCYRINYSMDALRLNLAGISESIIDLFPQRQLLGC